MRSTGIVRRIDDLGRVVIPKELRRDLGIKEGDPLEIFTQDNMVVFKKYIPINNLEIPLNDLIQRINANDQLSKVAKEKLKILLDVFADVVKAEESEEK